jgi:plastocyanin
MRRRRHGFRTATVAVVVSLAALGGCSAGGEPEATTAPTAVVTVAPSPAQATTTDRVPQPGEDCTDDAAASGPGDLGFEDYRFAPACLQINTGQGLHLHNDGQAIHNLSVEGFPGIDVDVPPEEENNTEATGLQPGTYTIFCKYHRDSQDMEGELRVSAAP